MNLTKQMISSVVLLLFCTTIISASDDKVALDQLPKSVTASLTKRFPQAKLLSASKTTAEGKTKFEVTIKDGKMNCDVSVTDAGIITGMEKEIAFDTLPKAVSDAVKARHPKDPVKRTEAVITVSNGKEQLDYYEVIVVVDGKEIELEILPDGKVK